MKKNLLVLVLTACVLTVNSAFAYEVKKDAGYISLNSSKNIEAEPNLASVSFAVENTAETAQKAAADNNAVSNNIVNALKAAAAKTDVIKTNNFSVRPVYSTQKDGKRIIKNYTAINSVTVETKDITKVANLIDTAIAAGANRTDSVYFSYDNEKQLCAGLYPELLKELRTQADSIAQSVGTMIDGVKSVNVSCTTDNSSVSNGRFLAAKALDSTGGEAVSTPVEAGKVKVRVYVNADFYVK